MDGEGIKYIRRQNGRIIGGGSVSVLETGEDMCVENFQYATLDLTCHVDEGREQYD